jgi:DoxX-like family
MNILLWIIQSLLSLLFMFAGVMKFLMPVAEMQKGTPVVLPGWFFHFIGACEILGGIGLILPALLRIKPGLTSLAAGGLAIITAGATVITLMGPMKGTALIPLVVCLLSIFVAIGRSTLRPINAK